MFLVAGTTEWCFKTSTGRCTPPNTGPLWGPNGSGKTTLLETLAGRLLPYRGSLAHNLGPFPLRALSELVVSDLSFNRLAHSAAQYYQQRFQRQDVALAPTVRAILTEQIRPVGTINEQSVRLWPPVVSADELLQISTLLSIGHLLDKPFITLSNGEMRRMLPRRAVCASENRTLLYVTHYAPEIPDCVQQTLYLEAGKVKLSI